MNSSSVYNVKFPRQELPMVVDPNDPPITLHFPEKIYLILETESPDIIRWESQSGIFRIVNHQRFEHEIVPRWFRHSHMSSVQRQLNLYGFKCVSRGEIKGAFSHPLFRPGKWEDVSRIRRSKPNRKQKGTRRPVVEEDCDTTSKEDAISRSSDANSQCDDNDCDQPESSPFHLKRVPSFDSWFHTSALFDFTSSHDLEIASSAANSELCIIGNSATCSEDKNLDSEDFFFDVTKSDFLLPMCENATDAGSTISSANVPPSHSKKRSGIRPSSSLGIIKSLFTSKSIEDLVSLCNELDESYLDTVGYNIGLEILM